MRWGRHSLAWLVVPMAALVVVLPLILRGCSCGHDFDFHLVSWFEAAAQFRAGTLHPAWAFSPAWNAGEPRFVFYPPLSWTLGGLLGMVLPWGAVPVVYTWIALTAAGAGMYKLAREFAGEHAAAIAAAVYVANPYMVFTAYERTAYAELLAAVWIPLLLAGVLRERVTVLGVAVPVALLWLTNAPAAVMVCYAVAVLGVVRLVMTWWRPTHRDSAAMNGTQSVIGGVGLGLGLAAFYVLPAAYERRWVQIGMAMVSGMRIEDNFLFHHTADALHDEVLHTASVIAVAMLAAAAVFLGVAIVRGKGRVAISLAVLAVAIGVMLIPLSAGVWRVVPQMGFLQFPWRLVAVLAAVTCTGLAIAMEGVKLKGAVIVVGALGLVAAMSLPTATVFRQACDEEDNIAARWAVFDAKSGTDATDEYTTGEADNDALAHDDPAYWLAEDGEGKASGGGAQSGPVPMHFVVNAEKSEVLVLNLRAYPAWRVKVNGVEKGVRVERADGLIAVPVAAGMLKVDISYERGWDQKVGGGISVAALAGALGVAMYGRRRRVPASRIIEN